MAGQMEQVLVNLAVNAGDAVGSGGQVSITVVNTPDGVQIAVADSGCGMDAETLAHVFDPFFTTKAEGRGTGLGLPTVQSIVSEHGGELRIDSAPGVGTTVLVLLPASQDGAAAGTDGTASSPVILVVDDDRTVRRMLEVLLTRDGLRVLTAADAHEALAINAAHAGVIDAVLTDVVLAGLNGCDLADRLRAERPALAAIFMSAHGVDRALAQRINGQFDRFIAKPFVPQAVVAMVRESLGHPRPGAPGHSGRG